jgi:hypothetical protein
VFFIRSDVVIGIGVVQVDLGFLENTWFVSIFGGIVSGLATYAITGLFLSKRSKKERARTVGLANAELIVSLRPFVSEEQLPTPNSILSLLSATARRYGVSTSDMYSLSAVRDELVKEVMDSSFISSERKNTIARQISDTLNETPQASSVDHVKDALIKDVEAKSSALAKSYQTVSATLGIFSGLATALFVVTDVLGTSSRASIFASLADIFFPAFLAIVSVAAAALFTSAYRDFRDARARKE